MSARLLSFATLWFTASIPLLATPKYHTLVITTKDGKLPEYVSDFIERRFPALNLKKYDRIRFYQARPELPAPACSEAEFYLLGPGDDLLHKGCLEFHTPAAAAWEIEETMKQFYANLGKANPP